MQQITGGRPPNRNWPCPCGSGIKFKKCHGSIQAQELLREFHIKNLYEQMKQKVRNV